MPKLSPFAARLDALAKERGLTWYRLGQMSGIDQAFLAKLAKGLKSPSWETVCKLADALGISTEDFRK